MKRLMAVFCICIIAHAQKSHGQQNDQYRIPAGVEINKIIPFEALYLFAEFQKCAIYYADGTSAWALANYNLMSQRVAIVTVKKDTVEMKIDYRIKRYDFGKSVIVNDFRHGLVEVRPELMYPLMGKRPYWVTIPIDEGIYDGYSNFIDPTASYSVLSNSATTSYERAATNQPVRSNLIVKKLMRYYFIDKNDRVHEAGSQSLYSMFPQFKNELKEYIDQEHIDFDKEEDLSKLMFYCSNLESIRFVIKDN